MEDGNTAKPKSSFDEEALIQLHSFNGKKVAKVVCYLWQNLVNPNDPVELIDGLELRFEDNTRLNFSSDESGEGLSVRPYSLKEENELLNNEFKGKIKIFGLDASSTKMWQDVIGKTLIHIRLTKEDGLYLNDSVLLDFETEPRTLAISPMDGLVIDYYEE
ncbi:MAG: hypothetical protein QM534_05735 [Sediminibacterium sp.]|nr:hypothetical protein [Sediminibacterium sp.]